MAPGGGVAIGGGSKGGVAHIPLSTARPSSPPPRPPNNEKTKQLQFKHQGGGGGGPGGGLDVHPPSGVKGKPALFLIGTPVGSLRVHSGGLGSTRAPFGRTRKDSGLLREDSGPLGSPVFGGSGTSSFCTWVMMELSIGPGRSPARPDTLSSDPRPSSGHPRGVGGSCHPSPRGAPGLGPRASALSPCSSGPRVVVGG